MKVSESWLREWVDPALDAAGIAAALTRGGLEVDDIASAAPPFDGVVVAEVRACRPHPAAERLTLCDVDDGRGPRAVVCGAPNVRAGLKVALALPGAVLPGDVRIETGSIRGEASAGMLCSAAELGLGDAADGLLELPADSVVGSDLRAALGLDEAVIEVDLTPNRGDCFCVLGIARDLGALAGAAVRAPRVEPVLAAGTAQLPVRIEAGEACPRYAGRVIEGVSTTARSPLWLVERLRRAGLRAIHPLVDVTNYVMLELGQPMHAFDLDRLVGGIVVRPARADERLVLLDGQDIELVAGDLVIADEERPVALAGVMGGLDSAVGATTCNLFLESAFFEPVRLAGVARRYRLHTDASQRFERGVDPAGQARALERATELVLAICGGRPGPAVVTTVDGALPTRPPIALRHAAIGRLLGLDIPAATVEGCLRALGLSVSAGPAGWEVVPPSWRFDLAREADLIEEVARVHGYDAIPVRLPRAAAEPALPAAAGVAEERLRGCLVGRGYHEAITYSFIDPALAADFAPDAPALALANPISSEMSVMRASLWPGLVAAARHNLNRQADTVRLFEIGMVFADNPSGRSQRVRLGGLRHGPAAAARWDERPRESDFFDVKQDVEVLFKSLRQEPLMVSAARHPALHPGQAARLLLGGRAVGWLGAVHPALALRLDLPKRLFLFEFELDQLVPAGAAQYQPISRFPSVRRDLAIVVDEAVAAADCLAAVREAAGVSLRDLELFDVYRGQGIDSGKKSLALGLIFQDRSSTLKENEIEQAIQRVLANLAARVGGSLRV